MTATADALAQLSNALDEIQRQARSETSEARSELDQIARGLHAATLEAQGSNQAAADARAALGQVELTIARQSEIIESQHRTIAELQREVSQLKDHSRNLQDHVLRIEGEQRVQSSRIDKALQLLIQKTYNPFKSETKPSEQDLLDPVIAAEVARINAEVQQACPHQ